MIVSLPIKMVLFVGIKHEKALEKNSAIYCRRNLLVMYAGYGMVRHTGLIVLPLSKSLVIRWNRN